jgi:hypothetical protein
VFNWPSLTSQRQKDYPFINQFPIAAYRINTTKPALNQDNLKGYRYGAKTNIWHLYAGVVNKHSIQKVAPKRKTISKVPT